MAKFEALCRGAALGAVVLFAGCTHTYSGNPPEDPAPGPRPPVAWAGEIAGLERFDRDVTVVTFVCSSNQFRARYQTAARDRIVTSFAAAGYPQSGGAARIEVNDVAIRLGCHPAGFAGMGSFCRSDVLVSLSATITGGGGRQARSSARREASAQHPAGAFCEHGGKAIDAAVSGAIDAAIAEVVPQLRSSVSSPR